MKYLFIESIEPANFRAGLLSSQSIRTRFVHKRSHSILSEVMMVLRRHSIQGICVVSGPGSFTAVRTGVLIANMLSRLLHVPLYSVDASQAFDLNVMYTQLIRGMLPVSMYVAPVYSSEPNITLKKA